MKGVLEKEKGSALYAVSSLNFKIERLYHYDY